MPHWSHPVAGLFLQAAVGHHEIGQQFVDRHVALDRQALVLGGALLAEMLFDFFARLDFSEVNGGVLIAIVTFHDGLSNSAALSFQRGAIHAWHD